MKKVFAPLLFVLLFAQCAENKQEKTTKKVDTSAATVVEEIIEPYQLNAKDTVYSVALKLSSRDSVDVLYSVRLMLGSNIYSDSLVFSIPAKDEVDGQIIFANSRISKSAKPTFTSKLKILNGK